MFVCALGHVSWTWLILFEVSDLLGEGWFKPFVLINLHAVNSIIMVIEMLCFNSIKRPLVLSFILPDSEGIQLTIRAECRLPSI